MATGSASVLHRPDAARSGGGGPRGFFAEASDRDVRVEITDKGTGEIRAQSPGRTYPGGARTHGAERMRGIGKFG
ncbi:hypothetical protein GCM10027176_56590 [Actinoallomurus bryophytorum]